MVLEPDAGAVEPRRVEVSLVLVQRLPERGRPNRHGDVVPGRVEQLGAGQADASPPQSATTTRRPRGRGPRSTSHAWTVSTPSSGKVGLVRPRSRGDDDRIGRERGDARRVGLGLEADLDVRGFQQTLVVARERARELGVHRRRSGERDLAAEPSAPLQEDDLVSGRARLGGGREAGRAAADDDDAPPDAPLGSGGPIVRSRPVRGFCAQAIGVPAW